MAPLATAIYGHCGYFQGPVGMPATQWHCDGSGLGRPLPKALPNAGPACTTGGGTCKRVHGRASMHKCAALRGQVVLRRQCSAASIHPVHHIAGVSCRICGSDTARLATECACVVGGGSGLCARAWRAGHAGAHARTWSTSFSDPWMLARSRSSASCRLSPALTLIL